MDRTHNNTKITCWGGYSNSKRFWKWEKAIDQNLPNGKNNCFTVNPFSSLCPWSIGIKDFIYLTMDCDSSLPSMADTVLYTGVKQQRSQDRAPPLSKRSCDQCYEGEICDALRTCDRWCHLPASSCPYLPERQHHHLGPVTGLDPDWAFCSKTVTTWHSLHSPHHHPKCPGWHGTGSLADPSAYICSGRRALPGEEVTSAEVGIMPKQETQTGKSIDQKVFMHFPVLHNSAFPMISSTWFCCWKYSSVRTSYFPTSWIKVEAPKAKHEPL